jgi:hypothetical protein
LGGGDDSVLWFNVCAYLIRTEKFINCALFVKQSSTIERSKILQKMETNANNNLDGFIKQTKYFLQIKTVQAIITVQYTGIYHVSNGSLSAL